MYTHNEMSFSYNLYLSKSFRNFQKRNGFFFFNVKNRKKLVYSNCFISVEYLFRKINSRVTTKQSASFTLTFR